MNPAFQVLLAGAGTYLIRISAIALMSGTGEVPERVERVLRMIAPAVLGALVAHTLLLDHGSARDLGAWHVAGTVALVVAVWRKSATWTLVVGMVALWAANAI